MIGFRSLNETVKVISENILTKWCITWQGGLEPSIEAFCKGEGFNTAKKQKYLKIYIEVQVGTKKC